MMRRGLGLGLVGLLLAGCATVRTVQTDVQTFSSLPALPLQPSYRFERLPSQQAQAQTQAEVEQLAELALQQAGWRRDDAQARYTVQLGVRVEREDRVDWRDAWWYGSGARHGFLRRWPRPWWAHSTPWYQREVSLVLRDHTSAQVVYETHALEEGPWSDTPTCWLRCSAPHLPTSPPPRQAPCRAGWRWYCPEAQTGARQAGRKPSIDR